MLKSVSAISLVLSSVLFTVHSPNAVADDCSISINSKESISCLQRKVNQLEQKLEQSKHSKVILPKGAVIEFRAKSCPSGWAKYQSEQNAIVNLKVGSNLVKCEKV